MNGVGVERGNGLEGRLQNVYKNGFIGTANVDVENTQSVLDTGLFPHAVKRENLVAEHEF